MSYQDDSINDIYDEIKQLESDIIESGKNIKTCGEQEARAAAIYEDFKNQFLIDLYAEESEKGIKRTEAQRTSLYRIAYKRQRLEKNLAANDLKAERDYLSALQSVLMAKQSRLKVLEAERNFKG